MLKYNVTLKTTGDNFKTSVEIEDRGHPVTNNAAAIEAAIKAAPAGVTLKEPVRVERI